jgi:hypothetical protein
VFKNLKGYKFYNPLKIRMQIYDGERGVVKCFGVYFHQPNPRKGFRLFNTTNYAISSIAKPILFRSSQKSGYDLETTSAFSI